MRQAGIFKELFQRFLFNAGAGHRYFTLKDNAAITAQFAGQGKTTYLSHWILDDGSETKANPVVISY